MTSFSELNRRQAARQGNVRGEESGILHELTLVVSTHDVLTEEGAEDGLHVAGSHPAAPEEAAESLADVLKPPLGVLVGPSPEAQESQVVGPSLHLDEEQLLEVGQLAQLHQRVGFRLEGSRAEETHEEVGLLP